MFHLFAIIFDVNFFYITKNIYFNSLPPLSKTFICPHPGSILDIWGMGAFLGVHLKKIHCVCLHLLNLCHFK